MAKYASSNKTVSGKSSFLFGLTSSGIDKVMQSLLCINVAVVAIAALTVIYCFLSTFFKADFFKAAIKIPTPYSCNRIGEEIVGTICVSVVWIVFLFFATNFVKAQN